MKWFLFILTALSFNYIGSRLNGVRASVSDSLSFESEETVDATYESFKKELTRSSPCSAFEIHRQFDYDISKTAEKSIIFGLGFTDNNSLLSQAAIPDDIKSEILQRFWDKAGSGWMNACEVNIELRGKLEHSTRHYISILKKYKKIIKKVNIFCACQTANVNKALDIIDLLDKVGIPFALNDHFPISAIHPLDLKSFKGINVFAHKENKYKQYLDDFMAVEGLEELNFEGIFCVFQKEYAKILQQHPNIRKLSFSPKLLEFKPNEILDSDFLDAVHSLEFLEEFGCSCGERSFTPPQLNQILSANPNISILNIQVSIKNLMNYIEILGEHPNIVDLNLSFPDPPIHPQDFAQPAAVVQRKITLSLDFDENVLAVFSQFRKLSLRCVGWMHVDTARLFMMKIIEAAINVDTLRIPVTLLKSVAKSQSLKKLKSLLVIGRADFNAALLAKRIVETAFFPESVRIVIFDQLNLRYQDDVELKILEETFFITYPNLQFILFENAKFVRTKPALSV